MLPVRRDTNASLRQGRGLLMPCYDYVCTKCGWAGTLYNVLVRRREWMECPRCHYGMGRLPVPAPAIQFKGSGWTEKGNK